MLGATLLTVLRERKRPFASKGRKQRKAAQCRISAVPESSSPLFLITLYRKPSSDSISIWKRRRVGIYINAWVSHHCQCKNKCKNTLPISPAHLTTLSLLSLPQFTTYFRRPVCTFAFCLLSLRDPFLSAARLVIVRDVKERAPTGVVALSLNALFRRHEGSDQVNSG